MKWGIRRYQPYPSGYKGNGKYTGRKQNKNFKAYKRGNSNFIESKDYIDLEKKANAIRNGKYKYVLNNVYEGNKGKYRKDVEEEYNNFAKEYKSYLKDEKKVSDHNLIRVATNPLTYELVKQGYDLSSAKKDIRDSYKAYEASVSKIVDKYLGKYGDIKIKDNRFFFRDEKAKNVLKADLNVFRFGTPVNNAYIDISVQIPEEEFAFLKTYLKKEEANMFKELEAVNG